MLLTTLNLSSSNYSIRDNCPLCRTKIPANESQAAKRVKVWSKKGRPWAQYSLGNMYFTGNGVPSSIKKAMDLFHKGAAQNNASAQYNLGYIYHHGASGIKQDIEQAMELYQAAGDQGDCSALCNLAAIYASGDSGKENYAKAKELWIVAAAGELIPCYDNNNTHTSHQERIMTDDVANLQTKNLNEGQILAQYSLGLMYLNGKGMETPILKKAKYWFTKAAKLGDKAAKKELAKLVKQEKKVMKQQQQQMGKEYEEDDCPICLEALPYSDRKFVRLGCCGKGLHFACEKKKIQSRSMTMKQINTCCMCRTLKVKDGSKKQVEQLHFWIGKGKRWAMCLLGDRYKQGLGVPQDDKRAFKLYTMAAEQGDVTAMLNLGILYVSGAGTEKDLVKAKELFVKAATFGEVNAIRALGRIDKHEGNTTPSFTPSPEFCSYCGVAHQLPETKLNACSK